MPQYQGVWTLEQQAQALTRQQWVTDPNFKNTTLLLQADGTGSGSQNQTFLDGSTNNFFITRNGNTTQGSFSPFSQAPGYWSNYFDGSDDDLSVASNANLTPAAGDFTLECWIYPTSWASAGSYRAIMAGPLSGCMFFGQLASGFGLRALAIADIVYTATLPTINTWTHVAVSRSGTTARLFINGALAATATDSTNFVQTQVVIANSSVAGTEEYSGYISNLRFVKGTAVYTSAFTPSTAPLTAVTNTQLLICQSNRFVDNSTNAFSLSVGGTPSVQAFGPFAPALQWTSDVVGGSGYFDGTGDYLGTGLATGLDNISGDFTIEYWQYPLTGGSALSPVLGSANSSFSGTASFFGYEEGANKLNMFLNATQASSLISYTAPTKLTNNWSHIAWVRSGSVITLYLNGTSVATVTYTSTINLNTTNSNTYIGRNGWDAYYWLGYIAGLRVIKGTAVVPSTGGPTTPPTAVTNTQLLLNYTNAGIYDGKMANVVETVGNAQVATSPVKYGSGSMYFDGSGDYLINNSQVNPLGFGSGDFTIEFWLYLNSTGTQVIFDGRKSGAADVAPMIYYLSGLKYYTAGGDRISGGTLSNGQWYHIVVARSGTSTKMFIDGTQTGSTYTDSNVYVQQSQRPLIGAEGVTVGNSPLNAYIDDLRVTKGVARYIANFTPPQQALPRQ